jgi:hypothetical protein
MISRKFFQNNAAGATLQPTTLSAEGTELMHALGQIAVSFPTASQRDR